MLVTDPVNFQRFACFYQSNKSLWILSTIAQNESSKIEICESESLQILKFWTRESGFANPNLKDLYRGFVSWIRFMNLFLKDSFCGFVLCNKKYQIIQFVSIRKDSYTNPASLQDNVLSICSFCIFCFLKLAPFNGTSIWDNVIYH
jgi:hypothetical protein